MSEPNETPVPEVAEGTPAADTATPLHVSASTISARTALILFLFAVVFTSALALTYSATRDEIQAAIEEEKLRLIDEVLPRADYDNALLKARIQIGPEPELGLDRPGSAYIARRGGRPVALVLEAAAPDGYSGRIDLVLAVRLDGNGRGTLGGVRVVSHKETPGLGDYIDPRKDRNKQQPWITQFNGLGFTTLSPAQWKVKKDGGSFDYMTGATISPRAVVRATARALAWSDANAARLVSASAP